MREYFVEILNEQNEWKRLDSKAFPSYVDAWNYAYRNNIRDETHFFRISSEWNDRLAYYGPCH